MISVRAILTPMTAGATGGVAPARRGRRRDRPARQAVPRAAGRLARPLARHGEEAVAELRRHPVRLVVLDIGLPGIDGFEVCRRIRASSNVPIVMLTARDEEPDRVAGFELGADDYVPKPFSPRELAARIKAILPPRRAALRGRGARRRRDRPAARLARRHGRRRGRRADGKEFDLLACFLEHRGIVLSRERLLDLVWGMTYPGGTRTVDMHVAQLRRKLGDAGGDPHGPRRRLQAVAT